MAEYVGSDSILRVRSNAQLLEEERQAEEAQRPQEPPEHIIELAAHIRKCFQEAKQHKETEIAPRLLDCQRRRKGEYSSEKLAEIQKRGGSEQYFNITDTKCSAAEAWIADVISPTFERPWTLEPTPIADLPENIKGEILNMVVDRFQQAKAAGDTVMPQDVTEFTLSMYDEMQKQSDAQAKERAERMAEKIEDQQREGGWEQALMEAVQDLCTYPICVLKGPVIKSVQRLAWKNGKPEVVTEQVPTWSRVNPHDFFPAPNVTSPQDGYICEIVRLDKAELSLLRDVEGYSRDEIDAVLSDEGIVPTLDIATEPERAELENRDTTLNSGVAPGKVLGVVFWGKVQGKMLAEWGMEITDPNAFHAITAILVGNRVIRAITNPDPLGLHPYYVTSYDKLSGDLWGKAIAEKMTDCQDACNASMRNALNNMALASGPMLAVDMDALDGDIDPTLIYPGKVWQYHGTKTGGQVPVQFFQPNANIQPLLELSEYFETKADDRTLIPRYAHGNENVSGAGETASGLNMLMQAAAKGIKRVIKNMDSDILRPAIEQLYRWNLFYLPDEEFAELKGDIRVVPRGVLAALVREETQKRRQEFADRTNNPTDMQIIGVRGRAALLRSIANDLDMPVDEIVPSDEALLQSLQQQAMQPEAPTQPEGMQ